MSRARATLTACEGDLPRSWATTVVFAVTTVMFVVAAVMFLGNYHNVRGGCRNAPGKLPSTIMSVAITGMFLIGTTVMFLASAVLCQATTLVLG